jgi:excisionase family DNA binding protein
MPKLKKASPAPPILAPPTVPRLSLSVTEAATASDLSKSTLYNLMKAGTLRFVKLRGRRLIMVSDLQACLASFSQGPEAA